MDMELGGGADRQILREWSGEAGAERLAIGPNGDEVGEDAGRLLGDETGGHAEGVWRERAEADMPGAEPEEPEIGRASCRERV